MANENFGCAVFAIAAIILAISTLGVFNKQEGFGEVTGDVNVIPRYTSAPSFTNARDLEDYQDKLIMNVGSSVEDINKSGAR